MRALRLGILRPAAVLAFGFRLGDALRLPPALQYLRLAGKRSKLEKE